MAGDGSIKLDELLRAQTRAWNCALGYIRSMSLMVALQLGIPDAVHSHGLPISLSLLASAVGIPDSKVPVLRRLMRALVHSGVFDMDAMRAPEEEELYAPTTFSQQLVRDGPTAAAPFLQLLVYPLFVTPWYSMAAWFRGEGAPDTPKAYEAAHGETLWESLGRVPEFNGAFNGAMARDSRWVAGLVAREHPEVFRGVASLVDVGGGDGASARAIKDAFPEMRCTVLELPHVLAASPGMEGVDFVEGDMFEHVPPADAVLLKWVLHAWDDEDCVRILRRCREAIAPAKERGGGKVIIIEMVLRSGGGGSGYGGGGGDGDGSSSDRHDHHELVEAQLLFDLLMLAVPGGRERDEGEWRRILAAAGFGGCKISPALGPRSIIEAYP